MDRQSPIYVTNKISKGILIAVFSRCVRRTGHSPLNKFWRLELYSMKFSYPEDCKMISEKAQQNCRANRSGLVVNSKPVMVLEYSVILVGFFHQL